MPTLGPEGGIARYLSASAANYGTFDEAGGSGTIFIGEEPSSPDNVIVVLVVAGGRIPSEVSEEWLLAVRVRDISYENAQVRLRDVVVDLQEKGQGDFGGINIGRLAPASTPTVLGRDDQMRWRVEQPFTALMVRSFPFAS